MRRSRRKGKKKKMRAAKTTKKKQKKTKKKKRKKKKNTWNLKKAQRIVAEEPSWKVIRQTTNQRFICLCGITIFSDKLITWRHFQSMTSRIFA